MVVFFLTCGSYIVRAADSFKNEIPTWTKKGVLHGYVAKQEECMHPGQLWIQDGYNSYCIRYFANFSKSFSVAPPAVVVFFTGDLLGFEWDKKGLPAKYFSDKPEDQGIQMYKSTLRMLADAGKVPFVIVSRPGIMGSSGDHKHKFRLSESRVMNLAVNALEKKFGFFHIVLAGHSGGALLVANLLSKRTDVKCAVMASGAISISQYAIDNDYSSDITALWESPEDSIAQIVDTRQPLIVMMGDGDKRRPVEYEESYANKLSARGLNAFFWVLLKQGDPHDTVREAVHASTDCAIGKSVDMIRRRFKVKM